MGAYFWYVKIPQCGWMEHGLKDIVFYAQNHITLCTVVITSLLVRDKPLGVPASVKRVYWDTIMAAHMYNRDSIYAGCCNMLMPSYQFRQGPPCPPSIQERLLNHWGQVTHKCVRKLTINGSDNGLSPGWCQAIIWTTAGILLIGPLATNSSEILAKLIHFHSRKYIWKCRLENGGHFISASMC